jgi:cobalamin biosynthetic protein CobC
LTAPAAPDDAPRHGGDLTFARQRYGDPPDGWLDLSTGINPHPFPAPAIDDADLHRLPDRQRLAALLNVARSAYGLPQAVPVIATPGSEAAIHAIPHLVPQSRVAIVGPTYGSHRDGWLGANRRIVEVGLLADIPAETNVVVIANPNNPDGRTTDPEGLADLARRLADRNGLLIVDEAFADLTLELSLLPRLSGLSAVVLRSLGKFYGLPGLRLGFAAGRPDLVARLERFFGAWPVSGPALVIGQAALADRDWRTATRAGLRSDAGRLRHILTTQGLRIVGGTDLFVLAAHPDAAGLYRALAGRGIWTRIFAEQPTWLRFGLPGTDDSFARLDRSLADCSALTADR